MLFVNLKDYPATKRQIFQMKTIITTTNFSGSAANATNYACEFAMEYNCNIVLAHIYTIPASYAAEGVTLATINDAFETGAERLKEAADQLKKKYPRLPIEAKMMTGDILESLQELRKDTDAELIIMGAPDEYSGLWQWDDDWLNALVTISCPVMVIPQHITYHPLGNIAFASDYLKPDLPEHTDIIKKLARLTAARFHIVHVTGTPARIENNKNYLALKDNFSEMQPEYHIVENKLIIKGLAAFIQQYSIDLLLVIPRKHGLWHNFFNKSNTKKLALLNYIPIMVIHENN